MLLNSNQPTIFCTQARTPKLCSGSTWRIPSLTVLNTCAVIGRYVVGSNRVLLMLKDGSHAWAVKDFLVQQDRCEVVTIEGKDYPGKGSSAQVSCRYSLILPPF